MTINDNSDAFRLLTELTTPTKRYDYKDAYIDQNDYVHFNRPDKPEFTFQAKASFSYPETTESSGYFVTPTVTYADEMEIPETARIDLLISSSAWVDNVTDAPDYLFNENEYIAEAMDHIDKTYQGHYAGNYQATSIIIDAGHGTGFNIGNIIKYAKRYGKKNGYNREELLKIIHYATMQLYVHDKENLK